MPEFAAPPTVGYCTNVHAGSTLEELLVNLESHVPDIRSHLGNDDRLPIGIWISRDCLDELIGMGIEPLKNRLDSLEVEVFTINGFPFGNFHDPIVKKRVYEPDWSNASRLVYTLQLARILEGLLPADSEAGISTVPIGWSDMRPEDIDSATGHLKAAAASLAELEARTGTCLHIDLEPEPGCLLQRSEDVVSFYENHLLRDVDENIIRRHLRICHDVCHAAVMFESQSDVINRYDKAGISIGKVQVSSALQAEGGDTDQMTQLAAYAEPRWMHQTCIRSDDHLEFFDDLPEALKQHSSGDRGCWRIHFHVPVHRSRMGTLGTTQNELLDAIRLLGNRSDIRSWEVETYAWSAMPGDEQESLAQSIARELLWTHQSLGAAS